MFPNLKDIVESALMGWPGPSAHTLSIMPAEVAHSTEPSDHTVSTTVQVAFLTKEQMLPLEFIQDIPSGRIESFTSHAKLRYNPIIPLFSYLRLIPDPRMGVL